MTTTVDRGQQARELFKQAYENRYTWDNNFPGYSADFELEIGYDTPLGRSGDKVLAAGTYTGSVSVPADLSDLNGIEVSGVSDPLAAEWIVNQIKDVITHRKRSDFESAHGKHEFALGGEADATGAVPISVGGDAMGSHYKIRDRQVVQVSRTMGRMSFVINHLDKLETETGYVSTAYTAVFTDPESGEVLNQLKFEDSYAEYGGYHLMAQQIVKGQSKGKPSYTRVTFSNIQIG
ncbi:DUF3386 domain-containing protein [Synechococcus sp. PCC 7336]|uniref:DUF3386 domain-containing protein n=1 Tax=Synechococcus sp. PCC 7336 TaxID=195250 RepID=UPI000349ECD2|nr:DUF3386 domain-containing protein [Synechococcus sp. PCC 7336]